VEYVKWVAAVEKTINVCDDRDYRAAVDQAQAQIAQAKAAIADSDAMIEVQVCDRVALFNRGRIGLAGRVEGLLSEVLGGSHVIRLDAKGEGLAEAIGQVRGVSRVRGSGGHIVVEAKGDLRADIARAVVEAGGALTMIAAGHASLEDVYTRYFEEARHAA
jgi:ABC-2 type transport system ATP-binding protein